jgi:hypothetical protein
MIRYADGTDARVGDRVDYDGEPSTVEDVLDSAARCAEWGVAEQGLMFKNKKYGLVFEPANSLMWEAVVFLGRGA